MSAVERTPEDTSATFSRDGIGQKDPTYITGLCKSFTKITDPRLYYYTRAFILVGISRRYKRAVSRGGTRKILATVNARIQEYENTVAKNMKVRIEISSQGVS
jgi:hypothetical protein